jgi:hypothetical protein
VALGGRARGPISAAPIVPRNRAAMQSCFFELRVYLGGGHPGDHGDHARSSA